MKRLLSSLNSSLTFRRSPLTQRPGSAVTRTAHDIAKYHGVAVEEVFLAWAKAKGAIVLTTSSKEERLKNYLAAGELGA